MKKIVILCFIVCIIGTVFYVDAHSDHGQIFACNSPKIQHGGLGLANIESGYPDFPTTKDCGELVKHKSLSLMYCEKYEEPIWVSYILTKEEITSSDKLERYNKFSADPLVQTGSAVTSDYSKTGFDRGHLAPNADMNWDQASMEECFYMSNITPQKPEFNRGIWKSLEETVRKWAVKYDSLYIVTGPDLKGVTDFIGKKNQVGVPKYFYKVILDVKGTNIRASPFISQTKGATNRFIIML